MKQCQEKTVKIWDDELVVGNAGSKIRGGILSADVCWSVLDRELDTINSRQYIKNIKKNEFNKFISNNNSSKKQFLVKIKNKANKLNPEKHINIEYSKKIIIKSLNKDKLPRHV